MAKCVSLWVADLQVDGEALNCEAGLKTERVKFLSDRQKALRDTTNNTTSEHSWTEIAAKHTLESLAELGFFFPSSSSFTVWKLTTTAIDSLPHSPWFRWCTSSLSAAVTCKCLAWAKWINKQYRNVLSTRKQPFSPSRSLCVIKKLHTCVYTGSQKCGHNSHGCFILYLYYFLHCRYILETSNIWERYME